MSNNKQSSVEWLMQQISLKYGAFQAIAFYEENFKEFQQAKAMHKEENLQTWLHCLTENDPITFEEYYNETYGGNK